MSPELPPGAELHPFGVARLSPIADFLHYDVTSVDSAAQRRRAFLGGSKDSYWTADGQRYAAIRVPDASTQRRKRGVDHPDNIVNGDRPVESLQDLIIPEQRALAYLRAYDRDEAELQETLDAVLAYDQLFGEDRNHKAWYRHVLEY